MRTIELSQGYVALVDDADYERVSAHKWSASKTKTHVYGIRKVRLADGRSTSQLLHRFIMGVNDRKIDVDHDDHNGLNNQRYNLHVATRTQNNNNRQKQGGMTSQFKGVSWDSKRGTWRACITIDGRTKHLGRYKKSDERLAARAYDNEARDRYGSFAVCNFPPKFPCAN